MQYCLIDGNYQVSRCAHAAAKSVIQDPQSGMYFILKDLNSYFQFGKPIVFFDGKRSKFRNELYPEYKANRKKDEADLTEDDKKVLKIKEFCFNHYPKILEKMGINNIRFEEGEADDLIYCATKYLETNNSVTIVTDDKDFFQMLSNKTNIFKPKKRIMYTKKDFLEDYGFDSNNYPLFSSIIGDSSDNIKGINGCGEKRVKQIFSEIPCINLKNVIEYCKEGKQKFKKSVIENVGIVDRNMKLMNIKQLPELKQIFTQVVSRLNNFNGKPDYESVLKYLDAYQFRTLREMVINLKKVLEI